MNKQMNFNPKISIIIPVYNGMNYMCEAIESALAQSYNNFEVIVVNDGSNDSGKTREIALSYGDKIRYFEKENGGVATALNLGIEKMTGEYFSWLSHDDVYYPNKLEEQAKFLDSLQDNNSIIFSNWELIDSNSNFLRVVKVNKKPVKHSIYLIFYSYLHGCSLLIPKLCFDDIGNFRVDLKNTQDYDLWLKFALKYQFVHLPKVLIKSRLHSEQGSKLLFKQTKEEFKLYYNLIKQIDVKIMSDLSKNRQFFIISIMLRVFIKLLIARTLDILRKLKLYKK